MNHLDLFSGIGGFALGARLAGLRFDVTCFSEINPYASTVYAKNFPDALPLGDIRSINGDTLRTTYGPDWIITGGFPCQDLSQAGTTKTGLRGERSGLWREMRRLIREVQPQLVVIENVSHLLRFGVERVLYDLWSLGLDAEWGVIPVSALGGCHVRKRVWIVAYPHLHRLRAGEGPQQTEIADVGEKHDPEQPHEGLLSWAEWTRSSTQRPLPPEPYLRGSDDGLPDELDGDLARLHGLGNAICPQIAAEVFRLARPVLTDLAL